MSALEIVERLCQITGELSDIVAEQQTVIEQSLIGGLIDDSVKADIRQRISGADEKLVETMHKYRIYKGG